MRILQGGPTYSVTARRQPRSIAVAQTCPVDGDVSANVKQHVRLARMAAAEGAQILLFPELSLTGYELNLASDLAFSADDPRITPLLQLSSLASITLIVGAPIRAGARLHIAALILRPDGTTAIYTKHYLGAFPASASSSGIVPPDETKVFQAGDMNPLILVGGNVAAVAICADIGRATHAQQASARGANSYLASMFVIPDDIEGDVAKLRSYAMQHGMTVALANYGCATGGLPSAGRSSIWSGTGALLAQLGASGAGIAVAAETKGGWRAKTTMLGAGNAAWSE